jgi:ribosomal protein S18 acetylase RimI-like enzyme
MIWYGLRSNQEAFIYDFEIDQNYPSQSYINKTLFLLQDHARSLGIQKLSLHVFGHNGNAYALYLKMGYHAYSIHMSKEI